MILWVRQLQLERAEAAQVQQKTAKANEGKSSSSQACNEMPNGPATLH
jgi:hypothetical protein